MQSLKQDQAAVVAEGYSERWAQALPLAVDAHNKGGHSAVYGPPETVESRPEQDVEVLQTSAWKGLPNRRAELNKSTPLQDAGAFRAPLPSKRSSEPRYGDVQMLGGMREMLQMIL